MCNDCQLQIMATCQQVCLDWFSINYINQLVIKNYLGIIIKNCRKQSPIFFKLCDSFFDVKIDRFRLATRNESTGLRRINGRKSEAIISIVVNRVVET